MHSFPLDLIIMAAGKGTRMKSALPKVLQRLGGRPLLGHVLDQAASLHARHAVIVTGHGAQEVEQHTPALCAGSDLTLAFARQEPQLGTGHAVLQAMPHLADDGWVVVLSGDVPLTQATTLQALLEVAGAANGQQALALLTVELPDPTGYGRIVRDAQGQVQGIVEHKDASDAQRAIREVYSGIMAVPTRALRAWVARLRNDNAQQEYYLTDVVSMAVAAGMPVRTHCIQDAVQVAGVNSPEQLAALERTLQLQRAQALLAQGVRMADPSRFELRDDPRTGVRGTLICGPDVEIDVGCIFTGRVELGAGVRVGAYSCIAHASLGNGTELQPYTHIDGERAGVEVGAGARIGPFARLRPGAQLGQDVHIGNFVEVKNSTLAAGAKANHLAYLGDATVGERVNYGAGSITANYDGVNKHRTVIEADVHVGSNCVLVAPVTIGAGGTIGAGSTISKNTPPGLLTVARNKPVSVPGWKRPIKPSKP